ncbi:CYFA0S20e01310g1_1 [Cyberlindnera fabianii]|uniref:CYFA0S20e01310g1_1 n=1 Tax=Cyberlindnera fabianii TaxID=36022 RepID=A0A061BFZ0_CYBFA|nr:CYFA0S20e01310g1_1 [Cyberlindnera fabianii]
MPLSSSLSLVVVSVIYLLIAVIASNGHAIKVVFGILIGLVGIGYTALEFIPSIEPPENFRNQGHILEEHDEEDVI